MATLGDQLPAVKQPIPGPESRAWVDRLAARECPAITARRARRAAALGAADADPPVWVRAVGSNVIDADGNVLVDLCAGFGVASVGHRHPEVVAAGQAQLGRLPHAMGDAFPDIRRIELMEALCARTGMDRVILGSSGSDAVEAALKTARIATGRSRFVSFTGGYHGLASAPLAAIGYHVDAFQRPFREMLGQHVRVAPFGGDWGDLSGVAGVLVEPVQGRGGMRAPPPGWLVDLHAAARRAGAVVIHDEVYTGLGRTGAFLASDLRPDLLCLGKALGGGFPISACLGTAKVMDAWGASTGEAIHTQTFLGNPTGAAMALAVLELVDRLELAARARAQGERWARALAAVPGVTRVSGRGLMIGVHLPDAPGVTRKLLQRGWIVLPCGENAEALGLTPPLTIPQELLDAFVDALREALRA